MHPLGSAVSTTARRCGTLAPMRLFIGIALAPEAAAALLRIRDQFAGASADLRWSDPAGWHVTLQFLGSTSDEQLNCLTSGLAAIGASGVQAAQAPVRIAGLDFFERAGIFFAGVSLTPELLGLQQHVTAATRPCGFTPEARPYHPHITLARTKGRAGSKALIPLKRAVEKSRAALDAAFTADEFLLYESVPGPDGSRYEVRARFPLAKKTGE